MRFTPLVVLVLLFGMFLGTGCGLLGGGEGGDGEIGLLEFDAPPPTVELDVVVQRALSFDQRVIVEIQFLYGYQVRMETFQRINRDLLSLLDYSNPADVDLDWVIAVHTATEETEVFFNEVTGLRVPESQREQYEYIFIGMLEAVQVAGYGLDRLLAAAVLVGPNGRSLLSMSRQESEQFDVLMREAGFYLGDSEKLITRQMSDVGRAVGEVRIR